MKKKIICLTFLSIIINLLLCFSPHNKIVIAEDNRLSIGRFAINEIVSQRQKIYISEFDSDFVESTGRTVYRERSFGPITPPPILHSTSSGNDTDAIVLYRYYYYAEPNSLLGKITSVVNVYNDLDSLLLYIDYLETVSSLVFDYDFIETNNAIFSYVRSFNRNYVHGILEEKLNLFIGETASSIVDFFLNVDRVEPWTLFAGPLDEEFIAFVDNDHSTGLNAKDYFASFTTAENYRERSNDSSSENLNGLHGEIESNKLNKWSFLDPFDNNSYIDLIHMFATMDCVYENTGSNSFMNNFITSGRNIDISGWCGDLQQAALNLISNESAMDSELLENFYSNLTFDDITNNSHLGCTTEDISADLDSANIVQHYLGKYYFNSAGFYSRRTLKKSIIDYYNSNISNRKSIFRQHFLDNYSTAEGTAESELLREKIYKCLALSIGEDGTACDYAGIYVDFRPFSSFPIHTNLGDYILMVHIDGINWNYLYNLEVQISTPSLECRKRIGELFYEFITD